MECKMGSGNSIALWVTSSNLIGPAPFWGDRKFVDKFRHHMIILDGFIIPT